MVAKLTIFRYLSRDFIILILLSMVTDTIDAQIYSYNGTTGPLFWPSLFSSCAGTRQSPISIGYKDTHFIKFSPFQFINYDTVPGSATITNDGHTLQVNLEFINAPTISGGDLPNTYEFISYNFHWGSDSSQGSEHVIDGVHYPLELQLIHWNKAYFTFAEAVKHSDGIVILAILFETGPFENPILEPILQAIPNVRATGSTSLLEAHFRLIDLLPLDKHTFYRYLGSLTAPECLEIVIWTVFASTVPISEQQLNQFRQVLDASNNKLLNNYRHVQPLNSRTIYKNVYFKIPNLCHIPYFCPYVIHYFKVFLISLRATLGVPIILG